jgi:hypothetical protein
MSICIVNSVTYVVIDTSWMCKQFQLIVLQLLPNICYFTYIAGFIIIYFDSITVFSIDSLYLYIFYYFLLYGDLTTPNTLLFPSIFVLSHFHVSKIVPFCKKKNWELFIINYSWARLQPIIGQSQFYVICFSVCGKEGRQKNWNFSSSFHFGNALLFLMCVTDINDEPHTSS